MTQSPYLVPTLSKSLLQNPADKVIRVSVPGSKSITNRALLLATLANGTSALDGVLFSDDSRHFLSCLKALGFDVRIDEARAHVEVTGLGGQLPKEEGEIYVGSAGTAARFLSAYLGLSHGKFFCDASAQMRRRPMAPLLDALRELGCEVACTEEENHFPFLLTAKGFSLEEITINIDSSSQFLSALLIISALSPKDFTIHVTGSHGLAYVEMTQKMMAQFGVQALNQKADTYLTPAGQSYQAGMYQIEPDLSGACYFYALAPLLGYPVLVNHVHEDSLQGDLAFLSVLEQMGCEKKETPEGILLYPPKEAAYPGVCVDMSAFSDQALTLAALAPFATSPTTITGIGHIRLQECDRLHAIVSQLGKMGICCKETKDSVTIYPGSPKPSLVETFDDHRVAMAFSLIGLRAQGIQIENPACCKKTFENYFEVLESVLAQLTAPQ